MSSQDPNDPFIEAYAKAREGFKHRDDTPHPTVDPIVLVQVLGFIVLGLTAVILFVLWSSGPIYFAWFISIPSPSPTLAPRPRATIVVPNIEFTSPNPNVVLPNCTTLRWKIEPAQAVKEVALNDGIEDKPVERVADKYQVCPKNTTTFVLKATMQDGGYFEKTVAVKVIQPTPTLTPSATKAPTSPIYLLNVATGMESYNWDNRELLYATQVKDGWGWHLKNKNPGEAAPRPEPPRYVRYNNLFPGLLNYTVMLGWQSGVGDFPFDHDHGYGVLFTTMDGQQWRFQLAGETNPNNNPKDYVVWALTNDMDLQAVLQWKPCNCTKEGKLTQQSIIVVKYVTDSNGTVSADISVNGQTIATTPPVPLDRNKPLQVGLVLFGVPAHAEVTTAFVFVGK